MRLPSMKYASTIVKAQQVQFGGLDQTQGAGDGALRDMKNLTGDHYPVLATRQKRYAYKALQDPGGLCAWDGLAWVEGTKFFFDGQERGQVTAGQKTFAAMGAYIVIFPDKCFYNTDTGEFGSLEASWEGQTLTFRDGTLYGEAAEGNTVQCQGVNWAERFRVGDAVTIAGCTENPGNNQTLIIREIDGDELRFYEYSFTPGTQKGQLRICRTVPELLYLCENENRLWGCTQTTIYASKPGDIFNWNVYDGLDSDSYAVDTGSAGAFTGCVAYSGYPVFFKEDHIYKVYGSVPSNFEVLGSASLGLARGCGRSLAVAGEALFYLSASGVMAYTGGIPQPVGGSFGMNRFKNAVGGSDGLKYYISMENGDGVWGLYVYDTQKGLWHKEDGTRALGFARWQGNLYCLEAGGGLFITGNPQDIPAEATQEESFEWMAEFADFTEGSPNKKAVSKLQLRLELEEEACVSVWLMCDSDGVWRQVSRTMAMGCKRSYCLPIVPRRADHYRLKLTGTGGCRIYSMTREYYVGSELRSRGRRN